MLSFEVKPIEANRMERTLPAVDDRLVAADCGYEAYDGVLVAVPPAHEPHAMFRSTVLALLTSYAAPAFLVACDMLTRTSETSDIAPDASVYPRARDPETGGRQLEQLAFEVVSTESMGHAGRKAAMLVGRGVRRVFAIDVEPGRAYEWSPDTGVWTELERHASVYDAALVEPMPVGALLDVAAIDEHVARALLAKRPAVLEAALAKTRGEGLAQGLERGLAQGHAEGHAQGLREGEAAGVRRGIAEALIAVLAARGLSPSGAEQQRILDERDRAQLDRWTARAVACSSVSELLAEP